MSSICSKVMSQVNTETSRFVDKYDVTLDVCISSVLSQSKVVSPNVSPKKHKLCYLLCGCVYKLCGFLGMDSKWENQ